MDKEFNLPDNDTKYMVLKMRSEDMRKKYWEQREVIGLKYPGAYVTDLVDHIDHVVKVAGINHVGISSDFGGGGGVTPAASMISLMASIVGTLGLKFPGRKPWQVQITRVICWAS